MFGRNTNTRSNDSINVNTTFRVMYSSLSSLTIGAWNAQLSLRFNPALGPDGSGRQSYDNERRASTALTPEKALVLKKAYDAEIKPKIDAFNGGGYAAFPASVSVEMGGQEKRNILSIEVRMEDGNLWHYLILHQMVKADNTTDENTIYTYRFNKHSYVTDYNPQTGSYNAEKEVASEFELFYQILSDVAYILPINAHGQRCASAFGHPNNFSGNTQSSGGNGNGYHNNGGGSRPSGGQGGYQAPVSTASLTDLDLAPFA